MLNENPLEKGESAMDVSLCYGFECNCDYT